MVDNEVLVCVAISQLIVTRLCPGIAWKEEHKDLHYVRRTGKDRISTTIFVLDLC
jgi:hypothetical protein